MLRLDSIRPADSLPAIWLIGTGEAPRNRPERSALRARISRAVIAAQTGRDAASIVIGHEPAGRPVLPGVDLHLSHAARAGFVAVALARSPIGVDVEEVGHGPLPLAALHRAEQLWLAQIAEDRRAEAFARLWAAKEAYGKWAGTGLGEPDRFALLATGETGFSVTGVPPARIESWLCERAGVRLALALAAAI